MRVHPCALTIVLALAACSSEPGSDASGPSVARSAADAASASTAAAGVAPAQQQAWEAFLQRLDRDGDGVVARAEHTVAAAVMFARMDRDGDEKVTVEEMDRERSDVLRAAPSDTAQRLATVDGNQDGVLDALEHETATAVMFDRYDRNGDARLVREEFLEALARQETAPSSGAAAPDAASGR